MTAAAAPKNTARTREQSGVADPPAELATIDLRWLLPAQALLVMTWMGILEVFGPFGPWLGLSLASAWALAFVSICVQDPAPVSWGRVPLGLQGGALLAAACLIPFPSSLPLLLLGGGLLLAGLVGAWAPGRRAATALGVLGAAGLCQGVAALGLRYVWLRARFYPVFTQVAAPVLAWIGIPVAQEGGTLSMNTEEQLLRVNPSFENLGLLPIGMLLAGLLPAIWLHRRPALLVKVILASFGFALWRFLVLCAVYAQVRVADIFWDPVLTFAGLVLLSILLLRLFPRNIVTLPAQPGLGPPAVPGRGGWRAPLAGAATALAVGLSIGWAFAYEDPGDRKAGRVVIDESHSDWEWTQREYDTEWYGEKSGYNYATLFQHLGRYYAMKRHEKGPIDAALLRGCDVLILKTPTRAYDETEVEAIAAFVQRGGGLYLIGDHTNVFGMTTYLNRVADRFGFAYDYDATYELAEGTLQQYMPPSLLRHPMVINMPREFLFGTSCSLKPGWGTRVTLCGYNLRAFYLDYARRSFFPEGHLEPSMNYGWIAQGLAAERGLGRVAAFTDSTVFSNFWYFIPGKNELFMGIVEWLNRSNTPKPLGSWPLAAAVAMVGFALFLRRAGITSGQFAASALLCGVTLGLVGADRANRSSYRPPDPHDVPVTVAFDRDYSDLNIPAYKLPGGARAFHAFYTWVQRLGLVPIAPEGLFERPDELARSRIVFMVYPNRRPPGRVQEAIDAWVKGGGTLVVVEGHANPRPAANDWLYRYGLAFDYGPPAGGEIEDASGRLWGSMAGMETRGGETLLSAVDRTAARSYRDHYLEQVLYLLARAALPTPGRAAHLLPELAQFAKAPPSLARLTEIRRRPIGTVSRVGDGRIILLGLADSFTDDAMGTTRSVPSDRERALYRLEFALLRSLLSLDHGDRIFMH